MADAIRDCVDVYQLFDLARRALPGPIFDFVMSGSGDEVTLRRNEEDFRALTVRPRVGIDVSRVDTGTTLFGRRLSVPLLAAPAGGMGMVHPDAECALARAFSRAGMMYGLSMFSTDALEAVALAGDGPRLAQLYFLRDDHIVDEMIEAARVAGYDALCVTLDVPVAPVRPKVERWHALRPRPPIGTMWEVARHVRFVLRQRKAGKRPLADVARRITAAGRSLPPDFYTAGIRADVDWREVERVARRWGGPFAVKGVLCAADARRAVEAGATALIVCNHGGIAMEGAPSTLSVVPEIVAAVGPGIEIIQAGGLRRGDGILKAIALGARAVMTARPFLAGLAVAGEAGVAHAIELLRRDFEIAMKLSGCTSVDEIGGHVLSAPARPGHDRPD